MRRIRLSPRLVNRKDGDPGLLVELQGAGQLYLFDCGSNERISKHELMRITRLFVTHTHIDHWIGFDRLLRHSLGEAREIHVYGPEGLLNNLQGKFSGYLWNLEEAGPDFVGHEIAGELVRTRHFSGSRQFTGGDIEEKPLPPDGLISVEEGVSVHCAGLEHRATTLGYAVSTAPFPSIRTEALRTLGLREGPWLNLLKAAAAGEVVPGATLSIGGQDWPLRELLDKVVELQPAERVAYVTDTLFNDQTLSAVTRLAREASVFFCEANFRNDDLDRATLTCHLTAAQAATFARSAGVKRLVLFHISRKYNGDFEPSLEEARQLFSGPVE